MMSRDRDIAIADIEHAAVAADLELIDRAIAVARTALERRAQRARIHYGRKRNVRCLIATIGKLRQIQDRFVCGGRARVRQQADRSEERGGCAISRLLAPSNLRNTAGPCSALAS